MPGPGVYWHNDDFLFETQFPTTGEELKDSRKSSAADELLERFLRRLRTPNGFTRPLPQPQPQPGVVGIDITPEIVRAFQSVWKDLLAKHLPQPQGQ